MFRLSGSGFARRADAQGRDTIRRIVWGPRRRFPSPGMIRRSAGSCRNLEQFALRPKSVPHTWNLVQIRVLSGRLRGQNSATIGPCVKIRTAPRNMGQVAFDLRHHEHRRRNGRLRPGERRALASVWQTAGLRRCNVTSPTARNPTLRRGRGCLWDRGPSQKWAKDVQQRWHPSEERLLVRWRLRPPMRNRPATRTDHRARVLYIGWWIEVHHDLYIPSQRPDAHGDAAARMTTPLPE